MGETDGDKEEKSCADFLKNTASNIMRLADEIHQCEGRKKYLAHTRSPSDGGDVRWYFRKVPMEKNELAAAVPRAETVEKSEYFRFGMRDSLAIEASFLQQEEKLLSIWWKEYAECSDGPKGSPASVSKSDPLLKPFPSEDSKAAEPYFNEEERVGVPVKGGLYEVDLVRRHCFPVYWDGDNRRVLRGHWFARKGGLDWLPLREIFPNNWSLLIIVKFGIEEHFNHLDYLQLELICKGLVLGFMVFSPERMIHGRLG